jgi:uncharacterized protein YbjT (DUF2867 family)
LFSQTQFAGDNALMERELDWVILRPSVVIGRSAYGASALMRGLAALPGVPVMPDTGPVQVVLLDDVVRAVEYFLQEGAPSRQVVELVGPRRYSFSELVALFRRWYRWRPAREIQLPRFIASVLYKSGDAISLLRWRPPLRSTAQREIVRGAVGDAEQMKRFKLYPNALEDYLESEPASVQERWFARMYFLKPPVYVVLCLF